MKVDKSNFEEWYSQVTTDLVDMRFPVKGMITWKPYGFKMLKLMIDVTSKKLDNYGHEETYFPMLISESIFGQEKDFLHGFKGESYVITHAGDKELAEKLILRPTSETVMYEMFKLWVQGLKDLPIKIYQTVNIFRYETKMTKPMLRVREIVKFQEAHTVHATAEQAEENLVQTLKMYEEIMGEFGLPYKILKTPSWDTFAGAEYNYDFISLMPDGKAVELCSVINLGTKFSKAFGITYMDSDGLQKPVHQTCYGHSERILGSLISVHGDDNGMVLPLTVTPFHVAIFAIKDDSQVIAKVNEINEQCIQLNLRVKIDTDFNQTIGERFYNLEKLGVPLRIEVGPRELEKGLISVFRRDTKEKINVAHSQLLDSLTDLLQKYTDNINKCALVEFNSKTKQFDDIKKLQDYYSQNRGLVALPWCGDDPCGKKVEDDVGIPTLGYENINSDKDKKCACGKPAKYWMYFGRTY